MANRNGVALAFVAGPTLIGAAHSFSSLLTAGNAAGDTASTEMSLAYGLLLSVGAPIALWRCCHYLAASLRSSKKPWQVPQLKQAL